MTISYFHGINLVADEFERAIDALDGQKPLDAKDIKTAERFLNKLQLQPPYQEEYASWLAIVSQKPPTGEFDCAVRSNPLADAPSGCEHYSLSIRRPGPSRDHSCTYAP